MPGAAAKQPFPRHRLAWWVAIAVVLLAHMGIARWVDGNRLGAGAADRAPKAIDVAFVRELAPTVPPVMVAPAPPPPAMRPRGVASAPPAASAAQPPEDTPEAAASVPAEPASAPAQAVSSPPALAAASAVPLVEPPASAPAIMAAAAAASAASSAAAASFDWPPSTRLSYKLTGNYRGPVYGTAQVDWLRDGQRYQVRLEVKVDPFFRRRMLSDGVLSEQGLSPRRYDEETEVPLRETRRATVHFEPEQVLLANGKTAESMPGVQDSASQFVQMTWLFLSRPDRLQPGHTVEFPLALPRRVGRWTYDVAEREMLALPFGEVEAFHLKPRRDSSRPNELQVETWIAPGLQYLPVRIVIRQDAESFLELQLSGRPVQAGP
jgi:Protein of unknown function (DUF3108)